MDPNECLRMAREAYAAGSLFDAADLYHDLDEWIRLGGFTPAGWSYRPVEVPDGR